MATKIRTKISPEAQMLKHTISTMSIYKESEELFELTESIKPTIFIKLDAYGRPNVKRVNLGVQHEHYSTWIKFDLTELLWNIKSFYNPQDEMDYDEEYYYALYDFKLVFRHLETDEKTTWEFDGIDFQIPKELTATPGEYEIALAIQEILSDDDDPDVSGETPWMDGNVSDIPDDSRETFISYSWIGEVSPTFFKIDWLDGAEWQEVDSNQLSALTKPAIDCLLADDGYFALVGKDYSLGIYNDNYIRYLRFNPNQLTSHLQHFNLFVVFKQNEKWEISMFEKTNKEDKFDDSSQPLIAWIPTGVYDSAGEWRIMIVAMTKNYKTDNKESEDYTDNFYRFLSEPLTMEVELGFIDADNLVLKEDAEEKYYEYYSSDFITADEQVIIGKENAILRGEK